MTEYKSWPLGQLPPEFQRPELDQLKKNGYKFSDPREVVDIFEKKVAKFAGAKYGIAVDCCSHGLFLSLKWYKESASKGHSGAQYNLNLLFEEGLATRQDISDAIKWYRCGR